MLLSFNPSIHPSHLSFHMYVICTVRVIIQGSFRIHQTIHNYGNLGEETGEEKGIGHTKTMQLSFTTKTLW